VNYGSNIGTPLTSVTRGFGLRHVSQINGCVNVSACVTSYSLPQRVQVSRTAFRWCVS